MTIKLGQTEYAKKIVEDYEQMKGKKIHYAWTPMVDHINDADTLQGKGQYASQAKKVEDRPGRSETGKAGQRPASRSET